MYFSKCFSCDATHQLGSSYHRDSVPKPSGPRIFRKQEPLTEVYMDWEGIKAGTFQKYMSPLLVNSHGTVKGINERRPDGAILRRNIPKSFTWQGSQRTEKLFGQDIFAPGCNDMLVITEGAKDALAAYQMLGDKPVIALNSATSIHTQLPSNYDYIHSFKKIYLILDNDEAGHTAAEEASAYIDRSKLYIVNLGAFKDVYELLQKGNMSQFSQMLRNTKINTPSNIISTFSEIEEKIKEYEAVPAVTYPWSKLQEASHGLRDGEVALFTALEGVGKTEVVRAIEYHLLKSSEKKIGHIFVEEDMIRSMQGLVSYELQRPVHLFDKEPLDNKQLLEQFKAVTEGEERVVFYDHFGSEDPEDILQDIRFMVTVLGVGTVLLDHISMLVSGFSDSEERNKLDRLSTKLKMLAKELGFSLVLVSHVNDEGLTRGSRNISKVADLWVHLDRNLTHDSPIHRNQTKLIVKKNRFGSVTGLTDTLTFDPKTFMVHESDPIREGLDNVS